MLKRITVILLVLVIGIGIGFKLGAVESKENIRFMLNLFNKVLYDIKRYYVEEKDPVELIKSGIEGMVESLDPFSDFLSPEESEEWIIRTKGEFGGLGIQIGIRDDWLTVIAPIEGTPAYRAGIRAGDRIVEIEGESTWGMRLQEAVKRLRGKPGTKVTIKIERPGVDEPIELTITRAKIHIKAVPFYTMLDGNVGYVSLSSFSQSASKELREAMDSLFAWGAKKIILDLRSNPGGLLQEAIKVANLFLEKGTLIVSTKGRLKNANDSYTAPSDPPYGTDFPLVVLVNSGSASASEIVAGAVQDWDRGILIGDTTFGKASVQRIFNLDGGYELKLTTAHYYTPSGRSIERARKKGKKEEKEEEEGLTYFTRKLKRELVGEGGIVPDIVIEEKPSSLVLKAFSKGTLFSFAVKYTTEHPEPPKNKRIVLTDEDLEKFKEFLKEKGVEFSEESFEKAKEEFLYWLKQEIAEKYWGTEGRYLAKLEGDKVIREALNHLKDAEVAMDLFKEVITK
jgi:carboxyl-terminal processing protease